MTVTQWDDAAAMDEMLSAYLDGDLPPGERESVRVALEGDAALRERYHDLAATVALLRDLPVPMPRRSFALTPEQARAARSPFAITGTTETVGQSFVAGNAPPVMQPIPSLAAPPSAPSYVPVPAAPPTRQRTAVPSGGAYPANVVPLRPRSPLARLVPLSGALSAVAAVLLIAVLTLDFTGGRGGNTAAVSAPASVHNGAGQPEGANTLTPLPTFAPAATGASGVARSGGSAPNVAPAPAQVPIVQASTVVPQPTAVPAAPRASANTDDAPNMLIRIAEIALALLLVAGLAGLLLGLRARQQIPSAG